MNVELIHDLGDNDWQVWVSLDDHDPLEDAFGFCIGAHRDRDAALADAVVALEEALDKLQGWHAVPESERRPMPPPRSLVISITGVPQA